MVIILFSEQDMMSYGISISKYDNTGQMNFCSNEWPSFIKTKVEEDEIMSSNTCAYVTYLYVCERLICYPWKYPVYLLELVSCLVTQKGMQCKQKCRTPSLSQQIFANLICSTLLGNLLLNQSFYKAMFWTRFKVTK